MAPRIVLSEDEYDELASEDSYSEAPPGGSNSKARPAANGSRSSTRTKPGGSQTALPVKAVPAQSTPVASVNVNMNVVPRRQAAIKANESMDLGSEDGQGDEEEDDDELDELGEEYDDQEDDDAEGDEDDEEEYGYSNVPSPSTSTSAAGTGGPPTAPTSANPVKIKLKLGQSGGSDAPSSPALPPNIISLRGQGSKPAVPSKGKGSKGKGGSSPASSSKGSKKGKAAAIPKAPKRKHVEMDENDDLPDDLDDEQEDEEVEDDEEDFLSDDSNQSNISISKMTARQRAAHIGGETEFLSLPDAPTKKKILTADEVAMRKVETSRRRKHLLNKKLEEEKQETIERLLKKPIGRRGGASTSRIAAATKVDRSSITLPIAGGVDENGQVIPAGTAAAQVYQLPTSYRWVSSIRDGNYRETWAVPISLESRFSWPEADAKVQETAQQHSKGVAYPPPRPPPKTRLLNKEAELAGANAARVA